MTGANGRELHTHQNCRARAVAEGNSTQVWNFHFDRIEMYYIFYSTKPKETKV